MDKLLVLIPLALGLVLLAAGGFLLYLSRRARGFDRQIAAQGQNAQATVTAKRLEHLKRSHVCYLSVSYTAIGADGQPQTLTSENQVSDTDYQRLSPGDIITVRYLPAAPTQMMLWGDVHDQLAASLLWSGLALLGGGVVLFVIAGVILLHPTPQ